MKTITVSGKTYDEAITNALIELQTTSEHLKVEIIEKGSSGLFGVIGGKPCIIKASLKDDEFDSDNTSEDKDFDLAEDKILKDKNKTEVKEKREEKIETNNEFSDDINTKADNTKEVKKEVKTEIKAELEYKSVKKEDYEKQGDISESDMNELCEKANNFLRDIFKTMEIEVKVSYSFDLNENEISIDLEGDDMGILIGKRGQTLDSLQYLVSLVVNKHLDGYVRVKIDTENYRERRKEKLEILAHNIARKVKRTRTSVTLEPMNPYERRIIHSALQHDQYVTTKSEGEDPYRHIVVVLKNGYKKSNQRRNRNHE